MCSYASCSLHTRAECAQSIAAAAQMNGIDMRWSTYACRCSLRQAESHLRNRLRNERRMRASLPAAGCSWSDVLSPLLLTLQSSTEYLWMTLCQLPPETVSFVEGISCRMLPSLGQHGLQRGNGQSLVTSEAQQGMTPCTKPDERTHKGHVKVCAACWG